MTINNKNEDDDVNLDLSSISSELDKEAASRIKIFSLLATVMLSYFSFKSYIGGLESHAYMCLLFAILTSASYILFGRKISPQFHIHFIVFLMAALCLLLLYGGGDQGSGPLWFYIFPLLSLFVLGIKRGAIAVLLLVICSILMIKIIGLSYDTSIYSQPMIERFIAVFIAICSMALFYEYSRQRYSHRLHDMYKELMKVARTDYLTNLPNRRYMNDMLDHEVSRAKRSKSNFSIIIFDIDFFKKVNDRYGHSCGDYVLKVVSDFVKNNLRTQDLVARWGGEEFLILLPETTIDGANVIGEQLRNKIENLEIKYSSYVISITISLGVADIKAPYNLDMTLNQADEYLYEAKARGRNRLVAA